MKTRKSVVRLLNLIVPFFFLAVVACIPVSEHPLSPPDPDKIDASVFGTWFWKEKNETGFVHIGKDENTGLLKVIMIDRDDDAEMEVSEFSGHTSSIGENAYFNLKWVRPENENKGYLFVKYVVKADGLAISLPDQDVLEKAVATGIIKGTVEREGFLSSVRISDEPEKIRKLFVEKDGELFRESNVLKRLGW